MKQKPRPPRDAPAAAVRTQPVPEPNAPPAAPNFHSTFFFVVLFSGPVQLGSVRFTSASAAEGRERPAESLSPGAERRDPGRAGAETCSP